MSIIDIAKDFTLFPGGRYISDGDYSGEEFRNKFLVPALKSNEIIDIYLDGTRGYGSSFLEEAFGGLVRLHFNPEMLRERLNLITSRPALKEEILDYIQQAGSTK